MLYGHSKLDLRAFFREVARASQSTLLLNYDGTLAPFHQDRYQAVPYPGVTTLLKEIMETGRTRLAVITGRRAHEVIPLLNLSPAPEIWGTHGLERLHSDGTYERAEIDSYTRDALSAADTWVERLKLHDLVEHKPGSLAVHWRDLADETAREVRNKVLLGWMPIADRACLNLEQFDGGVEIRFDNCNKADAVRSILAEIEIDAPVAYLGDDQTDEDAFHALRHRGLRVLVRPHWRETAADIWLRPPVELSAFLRGWLHACRLSPIGQTQAQWNLSKWDDRRSKCG